MQGMFAINPDELIVKGGALMSQADVVRSLLDTIRSMADPATVYTGEAADQAMHHFEQLAAAQELWIESLRGLGDFYGTVGMAFRDQNEAVLQALHGATR